MAGRTGIVLALGRSGPHSTPRDMTLRDDEGIGELRVLDRLHGVTLESRHARVGAPWSKLPGSSWRRLERHALILMSRLVDVRHQVHPRADSPQLFHHVRALGTLWIQYIWRERMILASDPACPPSSADAGACFCSLPSRGSIGTRAAAFGVVSRIRSFFVFPNSHDHAYNPCCAPKQHTRHPYGCLD